MMETRRLDWPTEPYKGLEYYGSKDVLLYAGREVQVQDCVSLLSNPETGLLLLHGKTGCGKSSFLRAGLIPALEEQGFGFQFLRRFEKEGEPANSGEGEPVFIICTADPLRKIAFELYCYIQYPRTVETDLGPKIIVFSELLEKYPDAAAFVAACQDPKVLVGILAQISKKSPYTLVLILDQAEEVLTLTQPSNPSRGRFFRFVRYFNEADLTVKFVFALRSERSGEFISYIQPDASVRTDAKFFLLDDLGKEELLRAVLLPTEKTQRPPYGSPYERYRFEYERKVASEIVKDLFDANPSGGVLPAMQIVCSSLYREVRERPEPRIIDMHLYESGQRVVGRVGRHISRCLREAFDGQLPEGVDPDDEERKWRTLLLGLTQRETNGTVQTGQVGERILVARAAELGIAAKDPKEVLRRLTLPTSLILRTTAPGPGDSETIYKLGHDAVGLALHEWRVREAEEQKRREAERAKQLAERKVREQRFQVVFSVIFAVAMLGFSVANYIDNERSKARTQSEVLLSAAARLERSEPTLAVLASIQSALASEKATIWWRSDPRTKPVEKLVSLLTSFPQESFVDGYTEERASRARLAFTSSAVLPDTGAFAFVAGPKLEIVQGRAGVRQAFDLSKYAKGKDTDAWRLGEVGEVPPTRYLVNLFNFSSGHILLVIDGRTVQYTFTQADFLTHATPAIRARLEQARQRLKESQQARRPFSHVLNITVADNIVYVSVGTDRGFTMQAYEFDPNSSSSFPFMARGSWDGFLGSERGFALLPNGLMVLFDGQHDVRADIEGLGPEQLQRISAVDLRGNGETIWNSDRWTGSVGSCLQKKMKGGCSLRPLTWFDAKFLVLGLWSPALPPRSNTRKQVIRNPDHLVLIDPAGKTLELSVNGLNQLRGVSEKGSPAELSNEEEETRSNVFRIASSGTLESMVVTLLNERAIDVFHVNGGKPSFDGTLLLSTPSSTHAISSDGKAVFAASDDNRRGAAWDLDAKPKLLADLKHRSINELVSYACRKKVVAKNVTRTLWFDKTGLPDGPPADPCKESAG